MAYEFYGYAGLSVFVFAVLSWIYAGYKREANSLREATKAFETRGYVKPETITDFGMTSEEILRLAADCDDLEDRAGAEFYFKEALRAETDKRESLRIKVMLSKYKSSETGVRVLMAEYPTFLNQAAVKEAMFRRWKEKERRSAFESEIDEMSAAAAREDSSIMGDLSELEDVLASLGRLSKG